MPGVTQQNDKDEASASAVRQALMVHAESSVLSSPSRAGSRTSGSTRNRFSSHAPASPAGTSLLQHQQRSAASGSLHQKGTWVDRLPWGLPGLLKLQDWEEVSTPLPRRSLFFFEREHSPRKPLIQLVTWHVFEYAMLGAILANCVVLAMDSNSPGFSTSSQGKALQTANLVFLAIFTFEAALKIVAFGFVLEKNSYLRDGWNILDLLVVITGWLELLRVGNYTALRCIRVLRSLRAISKIPKLRALVMTVIKSMPMLFEVIILASFFYAVFGALTLEVFGQGALRSRCAVPVFDNATTVLDSGGRLMLEGVRYVVPEDELEQVCQGPPTQHLVWYNDTGVPTVDGVETGSGRTCNWRSGVDPDRPFGMFCSPYVNPGVPGGYRHFDDFIYGSLTMFLFTSTQDWSSVMYDSQDGVSAYAWPLSVVVLIIGGIFIVNLFLATLYINFIKHGSEFLGHRNPMIGSRPTGPGGAATGPTGARTKGAAASGVRSGDDSVLSGVGAALVPAREARDDSTGGSGSSRRGAKGSGAPWATVHPADLAGTRQDSGSLSSPPPPTGPMHGWLASWTRLRHLCYRIQHRKSFERIVLASIVLNALLMALNWYGQPEHVAYGVQCTNYAFAVLFLLEMVIKLLGLGWKGYFSSWSNCFDASVTVVSVVEMLIDLLGVGGSAAQALTAARALRLLRLFHLAKAWKGLERIMTAFLNSAGSIGWLTLLLLFFLFVGSLLGMQIFGYKVAVCERVQGSSQECFHSDVTLCPSHWDCYVRCSNASARQWIAVPDSPYGGWAYCEEIQRSGSGSEYWAQVGKPNVPPQNFDTFYRAFLTLFQVLTLDNWGDVMYNVMFATSPYASLYFVGMMLLGRFVVLNLFLAILLDGFVGLEPDEDELKEDEDYDLYGDGLDGSNDGSNRVFPEAVEQADGEPDADQQRPHTLMKGHAPLTARASRKVAGDLGSGFLSGGRPGSNSSAEGAGHGFLKAGSPHAARAHGTVPPSLAPSTDAGPEPAWVANARALLAHHDGPAQHTSASPKQRRETFDPLLHMPAHHASRESPAPSGPVASGPRSSLPAFGVAKGTSASLPRASKPLLQGPDDQPVEAMQLPGMPSQHHTLAERPRSSTQTPTAGASTSAGASRAGSAAAPTPSPSLPSPPWVGLVAAVKAQADTQSAPDGRRAAGEPMAINSSRTSQQAWEAQRVQQPEQVQQLQQAGPVGEATEETDTASGAVPSRGTHAAEDVPESMFHPLPPRSSDPNTTLPPLHEALLTPLPPTSTRHHLPPLEHSHVPLPLAPLGSDSSPADAVQYSPDAVLSIPDAVQSNQDAVQYSPVGPRMLVRSSGFRRRTNESGPTPGEAGLDLDSANLRQAEDSSRFRGRGHDIAAAAAAACASILQDFGSSGAAMAGPSRQDGSAGCSADGNEELVMGGGSSSSESSMGGASDAGRSCDQAVPPTAMQYSDGGTGSSDTVSTQVSNLTSQPTTQLSTELLKAAGSGQLRNTAMLLHAASFEDSGAAAQGLAPGHVPRAKGGQVDASLGPQSWDDRRKGSEGLEGSDAGAGVERKASDAPDDEADAGDSQGQARGAGAQKKGRRRSVVFNETPSVHGGQASKMLISDSVQDVIQLAEAGSRTRSIAGSDTSNTIQNRRHSSILDAAARIHLSKELAQKASTPALFGRSLNLFGSQHTLRVLLYKVVTSQWFEGVVLSCILGSCITLALETPHLDPDSLMARILYNFDLAFTVIFGVEAFMKIIVLGFVFNGPYSYMRTPWNVLDFGVLLMSVIVLVLDALGVARDVLWLRALRAVRALRALRAASRFQGVQVVVEALFKAIPAVGSVALVALLFFYIFSVLAVHFLNGQMSMCVDSDGATLEPYYFLPPDVNINKTWCNTFRQTQFTVTNTSYHSRIDVPVKPFNLTDLSWVTPLRNFDNLGAALWVLFVMSLQENWSEVMFLASSTTGVDQQPSEGAWIYGCIFFLVFIVVCSFFVLNLVVSVSIDKFNIMKKRKTGVGFLLTEQQRQWLTIQRLMATMDVRKTHAPPKGLIREYLFLVANSTVFENIITFTIIVNALFLLTVHRDMSQTWLHVLSATNAAFTGIYFLEMVIKMVGLGPRTYIQSHWHKFDVLVVLVSVLTVLIDYLHPASPLLIQLVRLLRVVRIAKLIPRVKSLRLMFQTLFWSLPALLNVGSVMFVMMFIYAIVGMNLFGSVKYGDRIGSHANFEDFPHALQTLFTQLTGEQWDYVMRDAMQREDCILITKDWASVDNATFIAGGSYVDPRSTWLLDQIPSDLKTNRCSPAPILSILFFCSYMVLICLLMLQLVVAVILDNTNASSFAEDLLITQTHLTQYTEAWESIDHEGTSFIHAVKLTALLCAVDPPLGVRKLQSTGLRVQETVLDCEIPIRQNCVHFFETLHALCGRLVGVPLPPEEEFAIHSHLVQKLPKDTAMPKYTAAHYYAAVAVQSAVRGYLLRHEIQPLVRAFNEELRASQAAARGPGKEVTPVKRSLWGFLRAQAKARAVVKGWHEQHGVLRSTRLDTLRATFRQRVSEVIASEKREAGRTAPTIESLRRFAMSRRLQNNGMAASQGQDGGEGEGWELGQGQDEGEDGRPASNALSPREGGSTTRVPSRKISWGALGAQSSASQQQPLLAGSDTPTDAIEGQGAPGPGSLLPSTRKLSMFNVVALSKLKSQASLHDSTTDAPPDSQAQDTSSGQHPAEARTTTGTDQPHPQ